MVTSDGTEGAPRFSCRLCGLPVGSSGIARRNGSRFDHFCCHGCVQVFLLLSAATGTLPEGFEETELYKVCVESGIIGAPDRDRRTQPPSGVDLPPLDLTNRVEGMWCPSCAWLLEEVLGRTRGVLLVRADFVSDTIALKYRPDLVTPEEIGSRVKRLGYRLVDPHTAGPDRKNPLALRLGISGILTANIMMISLVIYSGFLTGPSPVVPASFSYPLLLMAGAVLFYGGEPILRRGVAGLRYLSPSMDTLIALGGLSAFFYSTVQAVAGSRHLYFDTASMLVTFVLLGRYIEARMRERASEGIGELRRIAAGKVRIDTATEQREADERHRYADKEHREGGRERWVAAEMMRPGGRFRTFAGETVPLDSIVVTGQGLIDRSFLTGESRPEAVAFGDRVPGGSLVREGNLLLETERPSHESLVSQIVAAVGEAITAKNAHEQLAERVSRVFVPVVLSIAAIVGLLAWMGGLPSEEALLRPLSVLLIACPCTLGLAIPLAKVASIDLARKEGIVVRDPGALERLPEVDTVVFDKTGTLTEGDFSLLKAVGEDGPDLFARLAAIEARSPHPIAREIVREARRRGASLETAGDFQAFPGLGVNGQAGNLAISIGSLAFMEQNGLGIAEAFEDEAGAASEEGQTIVFYGWEGKVRGFLAFGDPIRPGARELIADLKARGIDVRLVSGDGEATTRAVAESLSIAQFRAHAVPSDKVGFVEGLMREGHRVAMVGDGINDAAALAASSVGCAFGAGMELIRGASDLTFLSPEPRRIIDAIDLASLATRTVRQNLFFAFLYNAVAIPVAAFGLLNPFIAVFAMFASSLTVAGNSLRIARVWKGRKNS